MQVTIHVTVHDRVEYHLLLSAVNIIGSLSFNDK